MRKRDDVSLIVGRRVRTPMWATLWAKKRPAASPGAMLHAAVSKSNARACRSRGDEGDDQQHLNADAGIACDSVSLRAELVLGPSQIGRKTVIASLDSRCGTNRGQSCTDSAPADERSKLMHRLPSLSTRHRLARTVGWLLCGLLTVVLSTVTHAAGRHASMVIDANTGRVLHEQAADEPRYPASLTKMMTLYVVFELMEQGRLSPTTRIKISDTAASAPPTKLGLAAGSDIALLEAIKALIVHSANDISIAVAEHVAGTEEKFAALMTRKARQIGMTKSTFRNAHGLPDPDQQTTARDMLTLAMRMNDDFPNQYKLFSTRSMTTAGRSHRNHNTMLVTYEGMDGIKTGYIRSSGFNLVASVRRGGKHVVAVVFGGTSASARNVYMRALLDRSLPKAGTVRTREKSVKPSAVAGAQPRPVPAVNASERPRLIEPPRLVQRPKPAASPAPASEDVASFPQASASGGVEVARVRPVLMPMAGGRSGPAGPSAAPVPTQPAFAAASPAISGRPPSATTRSLHPSTLDAQADRLASTGGGPPANTVRSEPRASGLRGSVAVQVGAYSTEAEAKRQLVAARTKSAAALAAAEARTQPVTTGTRQLWRARFVGLDETSAAAACTQLRLAQVDCVVTRTP